MLSTLTKHLRYTSPLAAVAALLAGAACGGSGGSTTGSGGTGGSGSTTTTTTTTSTSTSSSSSGTGGDAPVCPGKGYAGGETPAMPNSVTATIVDQTGAAVANQPVFICGTDICSAPGTTGADGKVTITTNLTMKKPAFKFGDAVTYSELSIPISMTDTNVGTVGTPKLPATGPALVAGMDATVGNIKLSIPAGAGIVVNELLYDTPEKQQLRVVEMPLTNLGPVLTPVQIDGAPANFEVLYGLSPAGTTVCPAAKITVPNTKAWPAGTQVEFFVTTVDTAQEFAPYAGWAKMSDGAVSADGTTVSTADGGGFIYLDNFAIRKKP